MVSLIREIVSGKKNRLKDAGYNLDLTYISPRILAMSFPGSGLEITFRNNIEDVSWFVRERHGLDYQVYNLSGRKYNYAKFDNHVLDYPWEDHHSPPIDTLFQACRSIDEFLAKRISNVVIIHCLAGKGRTGTLICCYLLYCGRFLKVDDALDYYARKRFYKGGGVTQPSQRRYVAYFGELLKNWKKTPVLKNLLSVNMNGLPRFSGNKGCRPYIEIYNVRENTLIYSDRTIHTDQKKYEDSAGENYIKIPTSSPFPILGDILIRMCHNGRYKRKLMCRFAFSTAFLTEDNKMQFTLKDLDPDKTVNDDRFPKDFFIEILLSDFCKCNTLSLFDEKCSECKPYLELERKSWEIIYDIMDNFKQRDFLTSQILIFGEPEFDDFDEIIYAKGGLRVLEPIFDGEGQPQAMIEEFEEEDEDIEDKKKNN